MDIHFNSFELLLSLMLLLSPSAASNSELKNTYYPSFSFYYSHKRRVESMCQFKDVSEDSYLSAKTDIQGWPKIAYVYRSSFINLSRETAVLPKGVVVSP